MVFFQMWSLSLVQHSQWYGDSFELAGIIVSVTCELWHYHTGEGVQWHNIGHGVSVDDDFALLHVILMLLLDSVIYACIAWYIEAVYPGEYGIPRPFYFPFLVSSQCMWSFNCFDLLLSSGYRSNSDGCLSGRLLELSSAAFLISSSWL